MNYNEAQDIIDGPNTHPSVKKRGSKKLCRNTYLVRRDDYHVEPGMYSYVIRLYYTNVITYLPNGDVVLRSGGWKTNTTRDRFRRFLGKWSVYSGYRHSWVVSPLGHWNPRRSKWTVPRRPYIEPRNKRRRKKFYYFADGIVLKPDWTVENEGPDLVAQERRRKQDEKRRRRQAKRRYAQNKIEGKRIEYLIRVSHSHFESVVGHVVHLEHEHKPLKESFMRFAVSKRTDQIKDPDIRYVVHERYSGSICGQGPTKATAVVSAVNRIATTGVKVCEQSVSEYVGDSVEKFAHALCPKYGWSSKYSLNGVVYLLRFDPDHANVNRRILHQGWIDERDGIFYTVFVDFSEKRIVPEYEAQTLDEAKVWLMAQVCTRELFEKRDTSRIAA